MLKQKLSKQLSLFFREEDSSGDVNALGVRQLRPLGHGGIGGPVFTSDDLSFQMQLAIAMMESQRMMHAQMNNGMMPSTEQPSEAQGVPSNIQEQWKRFTIQQGDDGDSEGMQIVPILVPQSQPTTSNNDASSSSSQQQQPLTAGETGARLSRFHRAFMARRHRRQNPSRSQYASLDDTTNNVDLEAGTASLNSGSNVESQSPLAACDHDHDDKKAASSNDNDNNENENALLKAKLMDDLTSCSICLSEYEPNETMVQFPCGHVYHDDCAKAWVERSIKCPLCNSTLDGTGDDKPARQ
jgi:predicted RNA-binding Zn-ribbon protein involved in translation (DUF1610 family)